MSHNLKHSFVYVLELNRIVTPAKARLAFLSNLNHCDEFHFYCRHCGIKLAGKNIKRPVLGEKNQQPSCSDWKNVEHKPNCAALFTTTTGGTGGTTGGGTPPNSNIFIPEYLTFEAPDFVINQPGIIPEEVDIATINAAPIDFEIVELKNPKATYLLSDVIDAYNWVVEQKVDDNNSPKIILGNKGFPNRYTKIVRPLDAMAYTDNPVIYKDTFDLSYSSNFNQNFHFYSISQAKNAHRLKIIIPSLVSKGTALEKSIQQLIELKSTKRHIIIEFYFVGYTLPTDPVVNISKNNKEYKEYVIEITNPYLIIFNAILEKEAVSTKY